MDVKENNFLIALNENQSEPAPAPESTETIPVKLIDFNDSVIHSKGHVAHTQLMRTEIKAPELRHNILSNKADVWSFGVMALSIFHNDNYVERAAGNLVADILQEYREDEDYNGPLDQVIKACIRENLDARPTMDIVVRFLNGDINEI